MKQLLLVLMSLVFVACASTKNNEDAKKENEPGRGLDVDRLECSWNKTQDEAQEKCKPDPTKPKIAEKLDTQLNKDAKTIKKFFGIETNSEESKEAGEKSQKANETSN